MSGSVNKMLWVFVDETDMWNDSRLYEQIVTLLERQGIAGATVLTGIMGYGIHRRVHRKGLFGVSDERPITIAAVDQEEKLRDALKTIRPMIRQGLILLSEVEVIPLGGEVAGGGEAI
jgi:PII-like signaling protein